jgi:hypothetical protein
MIIKMKQSQTLGLASLALLLGACAQQRSGADVATSLYMTGSAQPATVASLNEPWIFRFLSPLASANVVPALVDSNNSTVNLTSSWVAIEEIKFKNYETDEDEQEIEGADEDSTDESEFKGPYVVDLLAATPESLGDVVVPAEGYRRLKMQLHEVEPGELPVGAPAELEANSMILNGSVNGADFSYLSHDGVEFEIGGPTAITPDSASDLLVNFRFGDMISKIDLSYITVNTEISEGNPVATTGSACPLIDNSANDLYTCFRKGIEASADFGKDEDGDGELEDTEESCDD